MNSNELCQLYFLELTKHALSKIGFHRLSDDDPFTILFGRDEITFDATRLKVSLPSIGTLSLEGSWDHNHEDFEWIALTRMSDEKHEWEVTFGFGNPYNVNAGLLPLHFGRVCAVPWHFFTSESTPVELELHRPPSWKGSCTSLRSST